MDQGKRAVALGFFDGVHRGHAALLERVKQRASELQAEATVLTFDVHPDTLVFGKEVPLINSAPEREEIIRRLYGIEHTVFLHFNRSMMTMPWQEFLSSAVDPWWSGTISPLATGARESPTACRPGVRRGASPAT